MVMTRQEYMEASGHAGARGGMHAHRAYYAQFVNERTIARVVSSIGAKELRASRDKHFNDIPLKRWDAIALSRRLPLAMSFEDAGDYATLAGLVCVAKEAADQWRERQGAKPEGK